MSGSVSTLLYQSGNSQIFQEKDQNRNKEVIIKVLNSQHPSPESIAQFMNELELTKGLQIDGVRKALAGTSRNGKHALVLEYFDGVTLDEFVASNEDDLSLLLKILISVADTLSEVHGNGIIHKDINPKNLLVNKYGEVKVIDFGNSTKLNLKLLELGNPKRLEGTLAYISPEQTGRMNRVVDFRSDLYSFGVVMYRCLTGKLPFETTDALELVHCHLAKSPEKMSNLKPGIPEVLCEIVEKLLSKNAEERYQSAMGLKFDLEKCLESLSNEGGIAKFELQKSDVSGKLMFPDKLYGRDHELNDLLGSFERSSSGPAELVLVSGYSGIGKSALVNELHKPITFKRGTFVSSKFDQLQRAIPHYAFINAVESLVDHLLTHDLDVLEPMKERVLNAIGDNGGVLTTAIPSLSLIIGEQQAVPQLAPIDAQNRFNWTFEQFIYAIASEESPLVIFIDDLQWADPASLDLLELLSTSIEGKYILLIGAYRNNEVDEDHALSKAITRLKTSDARMTEMELKSLEEKALNELISDALHCGPWYTDELTKIIYQKTKGNCFYALESLKAIYSNGLLSFDLEKNTWIWDADKIAQQSVSENVSELLANKGELYDAETQKALKIAACIGNVFDLKLLSEINDKTFTECFSNLWRPMEEGWIIPQDSSYKQIGVLEDSEGPNPKFRFAHDRIQEVASNLLPEIDREDLHISIGRALIQEGENVIDEKIFEIVNQYQLSGDKLVATDERFQICGLNLKAANKAESSAAFVQAQGYAENAISLLQEDSWSSSYELTFEAYKLTALTNFMIGNFERSKQLIDEAAEKARTPLEKVGCLDLLLAQYMFSYEFDKSLETGREALELLGISFPAEDLAPILAKTGEEIQGLLAEKDLGAILEMADATDEEIIMACRILENLGPSAFIMGRLEEWSNTILISVKLSLQHGNSIYSPYAYVQYGMILGMYGMAEFGHAFGEMACKLSEKWGKESIYQKAKTVFIMAEYVQPWARPFAESEIPAQVAIDTCIEAGNNLYRGYGEQHRVFGRFYQGINLTALREKIEHAIRIAERNKHQQAVTSTGCVKLFVDYHAGDRENMANAKKEYYEHTHQVNDLFARTQFHIYESQVHVMEGNYEKAYEEHKAAVEMFSVGKGLLSVEAPLQFYGAISTIKLAQKKEGEEREKLLEEFDSIVKIFDGWMTGCEANFKNKMSLLQAEKNILLGNELEAIKLYKEAIQYGAENNFIVEQALANELAGIYFLKIKDDFIANSYLTEAQYLYKNWGGNRKVKQMASAYPGLLQKANNIQVDTSISTTTTTTSSSSSGKLDLQSIIKASSAISSEIHFDKLVNNLIKVAAENAGAQKGTFVRFENNMATVNGLYGYDTSVALPCELRRFDQVSSSVVNLSLKKNEVVVVDNVKLDPRFISDEYFKNGDVLSVMCLPIVNHGKVIGALYLENELTAGAFDSERVELLNMLSGQIAVSIENATLYQSLERKVEERTQQLREEKIKTEELLVDVQQQKDRAEQSEQFKQQFLANMSHEIRTPMNAVIGMTNLAMETPVEQRRTFYLDGIKKSGENLLYIINDILDLSKIEAGKMEIEKIDFSLNSMLNQVKQTLNYKAEEKGLQLILKVEPGVDDVILGDPVRLNQVLINLAGNAIKFTEKGSVAIVVNKVGDKIKFSIEDTGIGIPEDKLQAVFDSFGQASASDTRKYGGTGLGLSISQQLIHLMGGNIDIKSTAGEGSTFFFEIDMKGGSAERLADRLAAENDLDGSILDGLKILVVDDNEYNRIVAIDTIKSKADVEVFEAINGQEAVDLLVKQEMDIVLMDAQMPVMNGYDATRHIRNKMEGPVSKVPILALTANVLRTELDKCTDAGMNGFIPKPFKPQDMIQAIANALNLELRFSENDSSTNNHSQKDTGTVTNLDYLTDFCKGDTTKMQKYVDMFVSGVDSVQSNMKDSIKNNDGSAVANIVHGQNSRFIMMGMGPTKDLSIEIENSLRDGASIDDLMDKINTLTNNLSAAVEELKK